MITKMMIMTPQDTPGQIASRKVGQSHFFMATDIAERDRQPDGGRAKNRRSARLCHLDG